MPEKPTLEMFLAVVEEYEILSDSEKEALANLAVRPFDSDDVPSEAQAKVLDFLDLMSTKTFDVKAEYDFVDSIDEDDDDGADDD